MGTPHCLAVGRFLCVNELLWRCCTVDNGIGTGVDLALCREDAADTGSGQDMDALAEQPVRHKQMDCLCAAGVECIGERSERPATVADVVDDEDGLTCGVAFDPGVGQHPRLLVAYLAASDNPAVCLIDSRVLAYGTCIGVRDSRRLRAMDCCSDVCVGVDCLAIGEGIHHDLRMWIHHGDAVERAQSQDAYKAL